MKFNYSSGQRPLEGYTLKRGIGRGGFGEVYFAVSDGGKEVALKLLRDNCAVEMRGVVQCLNLKHPHLVSLYDLRTDSQGDHWVVMEYIAGEALSVVLSRHPNGLPTELAREWFLALARAVAYLHDHGIVHRDLKPGNVFLENGVVKVGDYGLSKSIGASQRTPQTQSVGTVHYMAPEISTGNYNKQIDTYAAGVILYEMLSGRVPFEGESAGEILMKHLTAPPDLSKLPGEYVPVVAKALAKNPAQRYASTAEMARAIEALGPETGRKTPEPRPAPVAAERVPAPLAPVHPVAPDPIPVLQPAYTWRGQVMELCGSMALAVLFTGLGTTFWATLSHRDPGDLLTVFFLTVGASWAVLVPAKFWTRRLEDSWARRVTLMVLGGTIGLAALWLETGWNGSPATEPTTDQTPVVPLAVVSGPVMAETAYFSYYALAFFALRWWRMAERRRAQRFSFAPLLGSGFWGLLLLQLIQPQQSQLWLGAVVLVMAAAIVQLVSPWEQPPPPAAKRMRLRYA